MKPEPPRCLFHPDLKAVQAKVSATDEPVWICLKCAKSLGPVPPPKPVCRCESWYVGHARDCPEWKEL